MVETIVNEDTMKYNADEINRNADLISLAEFAGARFEKTGKIYKSACPIHRGDNPSGFNVYPTNDGWRWKCFTKDCGSGDTISFVMAWQKIDFIAACRYLTGENGIDTGRMAAIAAERAASAVVELENSIKRAAVILAEIKETQRWLEYNAALQDNPQIVQRWENEGIPETWQQIWKLGYRQAFPYWVEKTEHFSPTMTIPLFESGWECQNIKHRLLEPHKPDDKYRPEYTGIGIVPFMADPDLPKGEGKRLLICEGEKKAMVAYITLDIFGMQVIGVGGKKYNYQAVAEYAANIDDVVICYDQDGTKSAERVAAEIGTRARIMDLPFKLDDAIIQYGITGETLHKLFNQSRRLK